MAFDGTIEGVTRQFEGGSRTANLVSNPKTEALRVPVTLNNLAGADTAPKVQNVALLPTIIEGGAGLLQANTDMLADTANGIGYHGRTLIADTIVFFGLVFAGKGWRAIKNLFRGDRDHY
ncbi:hypothetical protein EPO56_02665 [Patescibacteria group bacterium]|nr:MAG: hypothetical protein EPO56_02665 [Patescibacteria group bacterium]